VSIKQDDIEQTLEKKTDLIVIAGGDGTITEVMTKLPDRSVPVALLPLGTANNIARSLGVAGTPQELVETWKLANTRPLDVGMVKASWGTSRFLEGFGVGLFAEFLKAADKREKGKGADNLRKGRALLEKWVKTAKPIDISITIDGKALNGEFLGVEVMNVPFTGPALPLAAKANIADGRLDIVCFDADRRRSGPSRHFTVLRLIALHAATPLLLEHHRRQLTGRCAKVPKASFVAIEARLVGKIRTLGARYYRTDGRRYNGINTEYVTQRGA
jgi:diacylglycerol kinase (ATP)